MTMMPQPLDAHVEELLVDETGSTDVEAASRLRDDQHLRIEGEFARQQRLLQIAAG